MAKNDGPSFFARYIDEPKKQPVAPEIQHAQRLLDWLQRWDKPTVCGRDILQYGPYSLRNPKKAIASAEILVRNGWLAPAKKHRFDMHKWEIIRKPIIPTTLAT
jgi:hypothetical protein